MEGISPWMGDIIVLKSVIVVLGGNGRVLKGP